MADSPTDPKASVETEGGLEAHPSLRKRLTEEYDSATEVLRVVGENLDAGVDRLAEAMGVGVEQLVPVLVDLALENRPRVLPVRRGSLGVFDLVVILVLLGLVALVTWAIASSR